MHGIMVWDEFKHVVTLTKSIRQNDNEQLFRNVLSSLRTYDTTPQQAQWLHSFQWENLGSRYGKDILDDISRKALFVFQTDLTWLNNERPSANNCLHIY